MEKRAAPTFVGPRRSVNVVGWVVSCFVPITLFATLCWLVGFHIGSYGGFACVVCACFAVPLYCYHNSQRCDKLDLDPSWYRFVFLWSLVAIFGGALAGLVIDATYLAQYRTYAGMRWKDALNPSVENGQANSDVGLARFSYGAGISRDLSMSFRNVDTYCVAPLTSNASEVTDFWIAGKNCCGGRELPSDFRCGDWQFAGSAGALRVLSDHDSLYYQLAVQQAEAHYGIKSAHPLFFTWEMHPDLAVKNLWLQGAQSFVAAVLVAGFTIVVAATVSVFMQGGRPGIAKRSA
mmetsp:Transcript_2342/g.5185  ORF Transcript_2342/g.5185 Transcript_2342/m.5185 type:complete len:292 (+) Transcript_2342:71-946(+)|eukprot:CAMPEP_0204268794 /NCGR_PEP_ID=MMETSP0468-20130131/14507_1 /ASSEMBLY_ACC=CAM_ASM_000383 /TAXON_ID=2969 /ORGANISM="Oxyrrhis marina" /LENGTH=291 /DNA_ID=CAMNT_0051244105 /DNA_START=71 /DNA_END=946 /DNA_ORIENTATION=-